MTLSRAAIALTIAAGLLRCQSGREGSLEFEAAAIKPEAYPSMATVRGGPGTRSPERVSYEHVSLMRLIVEAFDVYSDQVAGPDWLITEQYLLEAILPPGTTKAQLREMLRNLLAKRFGLQFHRGTKAFTVFKLTVAKGGARLTRSQAEGVEDEDSVDRLQAAQGPPKVDGDGCPMIDPSRRAVMGSGGQSGCTTFSRTSMADLATKLGMLIALQTGSYFANASPAHVEDGTGLPGEYSFKLKYPRRPISPPDSELPPGVGAEPSGVTFFSALEKELGLKLTKSRAVLPVLVIDHVAKFPSPE